MSSTQEKDAYIRRVKQARLDCGKTQQEIADFIGTDRTTYTNYENRRQMPRNHMAKFCEITNTRPEWLLTGTGPMKKSNSMEDRIHEILDEGIEYFKNDLVIESQMKSLQAMIKERSK